MRQFCWMIGMIGWIILKYDLCTIGHAAHYLTANTMIMCTIIKLMYFTTSLNSTIKIINLQYAVLYD